MHIIEHLYWFFVIKKWIYNKERFPRFAGIKPLLNGYTVITRNVADYRTLSIVEAVVKLPRHQFRLQAQEEPPQKTKRALPRQRPRKSTLCHYPTEAV